MKGVGVHPRLVVVLAALAAGLIPGPLRAEGDIVYSARYYLPGSRPSHSHLWRINPDGSGRRAVTSGRFDDGNPVWLADRRTILFMREGGGRRQWCTVADSGGPVTKVTEVPERAPWWWWTSPTRRMIAYLMFGPAGSPQVELLDVEKRQTRSLGEGNDVAWSPSGRLVFVSSDDSSARIIDLVSGTSLQVQGRFRAAAWLDEETLVAEDDVPAAPQQARLIVLRADGERVSEVPLPFTWDMEEDPLPPFADALYAIPGRTDEILYGRHSGDSTGGPAQLFLLVGLGTGRVEEHSAGQELVWSPDGKRFLTGEQRALDYLDDSRTVWVSRLFVVTLKDGHSQPIVQGLVHVGGFDWRP